MTLFRPGQRALIAIACCMVFAACATPPFAETVSTIDESPSTSVLEEDPVFPDATSGTTTPWSPFLCDLVTVIGDQQGSVVGTLQELKTGLSGLPVATAPIMTPSYRLNFDPSAGRVHH